MKHIVIFTLLAILASTSVAECKDKFSELGAKYDVSYLTHDGKLLKKEKINLWRAEKRAGHEYIERKRFIDWMLSPKNKLSKTDNYDEHKRGIEYYPADFPSKEAATEWSLHSQFVSDSFIQAQKEMSQSGQGCELVIHYSGNKTTLYWLPNKRIFEYFVIENGKRKTEWKLIELITDKATISHAFSSRDHYNLTDFADIGDNESDPFLTKMINLGFVKHGASGFYNARGEQLDAASGHHHH